MYLKEESPPLREISSKKWVEVIFRRAQLSSIHSALGLLRSYQRKDGPRTHFTGGLFKLREDTQYQKECPKVPSTKFLYVIWSIFYRTQN